MIVCSYSYDRYNEDANGLEQGIPAPVSRQPCWALPWPIRSATVNRDLGFP